MVVVTAPDETFALPATVMMRSVVDQCREAQSVDFYVLDCGLSAWSRHKMRRSLPLGWARLHFVQIPLDRLAGLRVDDHIPTAAYARLLMGELLPESVDRILYLDGDMVALTDVRPLWEVDLEGHLLGAVQDPVAGRVGQSPEMMHWKDWEVPEGMPVFNSGLMVLDLKRWRQERVFERVLEAARRHMARMRWHDQDALNYVARGDFLHLDPAWNVMPHLYYTPHRDRVIYEKPVSKRCIRAPRILHFCMDHRPWKGPGRHWREAEFYRYLFRTAWKHDVYCAPWMGRGHGLLRFWKRRAKAWGTRAAPKNIGTGREKTATSRGGQGQV